MVYNLMQFKVQTSHSKLQHQGNEDRTSPEHYSTVHAYCKTRQVFFCSFTSEVFDYRTENRLARKVALLHPLSLFWSVIWLAFAGSKANMGPWFLVLTQIFQWSEFIISSNGFKLLGAQILDFSSASTVSTNTIVIMSSVVCAWNPHVTT